MTLGIKELYTGWFSESIQQAIKSQLASFESSMSGLWIYWLESRASGKPETLKIYLLSLKLNNWVGLQSLGCFFTVSALKYFLFFKFFVFSLVITIPSLHQLDRVTILRFRTIIFSFAVMWSVGVSSGFFTGFALSAENNFP